MTRTLLAVESDKTAWPIFVFALFLGIPFTGWIRTVLGDSVLGRLTVQDVGFLFLFLSTGSRVWRFRITWDILIIALLNAGILLSVLANGNASGFKDVVIHFYLFVQYFVLRNLLEEPVQQKYLLSGLLFSFYLALMIAFISKIISTPYLPQYTIALQGSFLNGSQYGSFIAVIVTPLYAAYFTKMVSRKGPQEFFNGFQSRVLLPFAVILAPLLIFYSSKRSAMISLILGIILSIPFMLFVKPVKAIKVIIGFAITCVIVLVLLFAFYGDLLSDINYIFSRYLNSSKVVSGDGFFITNILYARDAFFSNPIFGQGYGAAGIKFSGIIHEIHSTYMTWLGSGGLVTVIPGFMILSMTLYGLYKLAAGDNGERKYFALFMMIFLLGLYVSMAYAYLPRRREFWVIMALINAYSVRKRFLPEINC